MKSIGEQYKMKLPVSVIILTYNEEDKIKDCILSVADFASDIFVVDSNSTDKTIVIAKNYTDKIYYHAFDNWANQRNWAQEHLPIKTEWVLHLDADHRVSKNLKEELINIFISGEDKKYSGFLISRKTIFMGRWIKHGGHYPVYHAVLFKKQFGRCEEALYDQHFIVNGSLKILRADIEDIFVEELRDFVSKHKKWAKLEAANQLALQAATNGKRILGRLTGNPVEKRRFLKNVYMRFPLFIRPFIYFFYRYFLRLGFLDMREGLIFHFYQGFWFRMLVDIEIYKMKKNYKTGKL